MKRYFLIALSFLLVSGCDDAAAQIEDADFHRYAPGTSTLTEVKTQFPRYSEEFVWHSQSEENAEEGAGAEVTLVYHTRHGHYFLRFEDEVLVHKRKLP